MKCASCGGREFDVYLDMGEYKLLKCRECSLVFTYPVPDFNELESINKSIYSAKEYKTSYLTNIRAMKRFKKNVKTVKSVVSTGKILDVGCSAGLFLREAKENGFETYGVEVCSATGEIAREKFNINVFCGFLEEAGFPDGYFDAITLWDVLEHIPDTNAFLKEIRRILKPGGGLFVQCPNVDSVMAGIGGKSWIWYTVPDHLYHFSQKTLKAVIEKNGMLVRRLTTWERAGDFTINLYNKYLNKLLKVKFLNTLLWKLSIIPTAIVWILKPVWILQNKGGLIFCVCRK